MEKSLMKDNRFVDNGLNTTIKSLPSKFLQGLLNSRCTKLGAKVLTYSIPEHFAVLYRQVG
jgi:hypothetical protein